MTAWTLLIGAVGGALSNLALRIWQYRRDNWINRVDWFCETLEQVAELAAEYWCEAGEEDCQARDRKREAILLGLQMRLDGMMPTFEGRFFPADRARIQDCLSRLRETLTGGTFQSASLKPDVDRARDVQAHISDLIIEVRRSSDAAMAPFAIISLNRWLPRKYEGGAC